MTELESKPARGRPRTMDTNDVLDIAMSAYWYGDPADISVNAICKMAGVSKPSIYREFQSEDGLTYAALEKYAHSVLGTLLKIVEGQDDFRSKIDQMVVSFVEDKRHESGCLFVKMRAGKSRMGPKTQALIEEIDQATIDAFTKLLVQGRDSGEWIGTVPIELGARYLHAQFGLALDQRARGQDPKETLEIALSALNS